MNPRPIVLTHCALRDFHGLPADARGKLAKTLFLLSDNYRHPSLRTSRVEGTAGERFEVRVDQKYRLVVESTGGAIYVLLADDHDVAYRRAPGVRSAESLDLAELGSADRVAESGPQPLFPPDLRESLLHECVPDDQIDRVLAVMDEEDLYGLDLPESARDRLLEIAWGEGKPLLEILPQSEIEIEQVLEPVPARFVWKLPDEHRGLVSRTIDGPLLVRGSAGSGKTAVAVHRAVRAIRQPGLFESPAQAAVLFVCYNRSLARMVREAFDSHLGDLAAKVEVKRIDAWCLDYLAARGRQVEILRPDDQKGVLRDAIRATRRAGRVDTGILDDLSEDFLGEEITQVIEGRVALHWDAYRGLVRIGRRKALDTLQREVVWAVYQEYVNLLGIYGGVDWDGLGNETWKALEEDSEPPLYREVIVDETQDLSPAKLRICVRLAERRRVVFLADEAQKIYRPGFRWKDIGLSMSGRTENLTRNLRQSVQVHRFVRAVGDTLQDTKTSSPSDELVEVEHRPAFRTGPPPSVVTCSRFENELEFIVERVRAILDTKAREPGEIAILTMKNRLVTALERRLTGVGVPVVTSRNLADPAMFGQEKVKIMTCHSAKGIDFPVVILADMNDGVFPYHAVGASQDAAVVAEDRSRRVLYVACSRAVEELWITCTRGNESPFLQEIDRGLYRRMIYPT